MLRVILELDDVVSAVVAAHQVRLRSASHPAYVFDGKHHGGACYSSTLCAASALCERKE